MEAPWLSLGSRRNSNSRKFVDASFVPFCELDFPFCDLAFQVGWGLVSHQPCFGVRTAGTRHRGRNKKDSLAQSHLSDTKLSHTSHFDRGLRRSQPGFVVPNNSICVSRHRTRRSRIQPLRIVRYPSSHQHGASALTWLVAKPFAGQRNCRRRLPTGMAARTKSNQKQSAKMQTVAYQYSLARNTFSKLLAIPFQQSS